jgi:predicted O-methyltransferase YrrM
MSRIGNMMRLLANLGRIAVRRPQRFSHILGHALAASEEVAFRDRDLLRLPQVSLAELQSGDTSIPVTLQMFPAAVASISPLEFIALILLLKRVDARSVFEFGTYKGVSITQLALNLPQGAQVYTLDLPDKAGPTRYAITDPHDVMIARDNGKGSLVPETIRPRIQFLKQDSAQFDESPLAGSIDFVFVDGAHNLDYVRNDSEKGWRMVRPGGIIAWHDCRPSDPDVVRYLLACPYQPARIAGTTLAFAVKPSAGAAGAG